MQTILAEKPGAADVLQVLDLPVPTPGRGQVLIRVASASVNFSDVMRRRGDPYPIPTRFPYTPGSEVAGTVESVGPEVDPGMAGQTVFALAGSDGSGGYAQYALASAALESGGEDTFAQTVAALAVFGTVVVYGFASGRPLVFAPTLVEQFFYSPSPNQTIRAFNLAGYAFGRREVFGAAMGRLVSLVMQGAVRIDIERVPLASAADAHRRLEERYSLGKIVLNPWA